MKQISVKGLADFIEASPVRQRTIVRQFKYPKEDEARAKIVYYREARDTIEAYHRGRHAVPWLEEQAGRLDMIAAGLIGRSKTRLQHNTRGIRAYGRHFSSHAYRPIDDLKLHLTYSDVRVTVNPDLRVREASDEFVLKLEFGVDEPSETEIKVISQLMYEAVSAARLQLKSGNILYLDVPRGRGASRSTGRSSHASKHRSGMPNDFGDMGSYLNLAGCGVCRM